MRADWLIFDSSLAMTSARKRHSKFKGMRAGSPSLPPKRESLLARYFLKGNYDKYNLMLLGGKNKNEDSPSINVKIDEQVIKSSPDLKLLGVTLDDEVPI